MLTRTYHLSPQSKLLVEGKEGEHRYLVCIHPLQAHRLNESAFALLQALRPGVPLHHLVAPITLEVLDFLEEKAATGTLRASYGLAHGESFAGLVPPVFEVIIPVLDNPVGLSRCLRGLIAQDYPQALFRVTVVDDGSATPQQQLVDSACSQGLTLRWLRLPKNLGPASARNAAVNTPWPKEAADDPGNSLLNGQGVQGPQGNPEPPLLAFLDSDCVPGPGWLSALALLLKGEDEREGDAGNANAMGLCLVGTRLMPPDARDVGNGQANKRANLLARYEGECSSLHMGRKAGPVALPGRGIPYLPSANMGVKRAAFKRVGGFTEGLRFGEDVDLCWRLRRGGGRLFYFPHEEAEDEAATAVRHTYRDRWGGFLQRKRLYARSEAWLRRMHPERFPASQTRLARLMWWALAGISCLESTGASWTGLPALPAYTTLPAWFLLPTWGVALMLMGSLCAADFLGRLFRGRPRTGGAGGWPKRLLGWRPRLLAAGRGTLAALLAEARIQCRHFLPGWFALLAVWPRIWPVLLALMALGSVGERLARRPVLDVPTFLLGYWGECLAYSLGKWEGELELGLRSLRESPRKPMGKTR